jgi:hypothetical protein
MKPLSTSRLGRTANWQIAAVLLMSALGIAGCASLKPVDVQPLYSAGMGYDAVSQLKSMKIAPEEVSDVVIARQAGFSDAACVQVMQIQRTRNQTFNVGAAIKDLMSAGVSENLALDLERMNELGLEAGEIETMRLAGLSEDILLAVARRHAANQPVLSGASLAGMKNMGMRTDTLLQLAQRGVTDSQASAILAMRRHGAKDADILRQFAGS